MRSQGLDLTFGEIFLARVRALGSLSYYLGYHLLRYYLVPLALTVFFYPPLVVLVLVILLGVATVDHRVRRPRLGLPFFWFFYALEQLSYGSGVFWGCLKLKSFSCYRLNLNDAQTTS